MNRILIAIIIFTGLWYIFIYNSYNDINNYSHQVTYTIQENDSLFSIVKDQYGETVNVNEMIYKIKQDNRLDTNYMLHPGQKIILYKE